MLHLVTFRGALAGDRDIYFPALVEAPCTTPFGRTLYSSREETFVRLMLRGTRGKYGLPSRTAYSQCTFCPVVYYIIPPVTHGCIEFFNRRAREKRKDFFSVASRGRRGLPSDCNVLSLRGVRKSSIPRCKDLGISQVSWTRLCVLLIDRVISFLERLMFLFQTHLYLAAAIAELDEQGRMAVSITS